MILPEGLALLLALAVLAALWDRGSWIVRVVQDWFPSAQRSRRLAEDAAYERWKREGGSLRFDSLWSEAAQGKPSEAAAARPQVPGRMSTEEARRKLDALLELTVARGATPAEAATARAIAERLKAEYDLN
jgi:hypothetical protein